MYVLHSFPLKGTVGSHPHPLHLRNASKSSQLDWQNGYKNLDLIEQFEKNDYMHISCVLLLCRILELVNYFFIQRWRSNIKRDIVQ